MVSTKLKIFKDGTKEDEINKFMEDNLVIKDGLVIRDNGKIYIMYITPDDAEKQDIDARPTGISKDEAADFVGTQLAKLQSNRLVHTLELRWAIKVELMARGGKEQKDKASLDVAQAERQMESDDTQIRQYRDLIKEIYDGKYPL